MLFIATNMYLFQFLHVTPTCVHLKLIKEGCMEFYEHCCWKTLSLCAFSLKQWQKNQQNAHWGFQLLARRNLNVLSLPGSNWNVLLTSLSLYFTAKWVIHPWFSLLKNIHSLKSQIFVFLSWHFFPQLLRGICVTHLFVQQSCIFWSAYRTDSEMLAVHVAVVDVAVNPPLPVSTLLWQTVGELSAYTYKL